LPAHERRQARHSADFPSGDHAVNLASIRLHTKPFGEDRVGSVCGRPKSRCRFGSDYRNPWGLPRGQAC
jgi:hypothetical protein